MAVHINLLERIVCSFQTPTPGGDQTQPKPEPPLGRGAYLAGLAGQPTGKYFTASTAVKASGQEENRAKYVPPEMCFVGTHENQLGLVILNSRYF